MSSTRKSLLTILGLITVTTAALAAMGAMEADVPHHPPVPSSSHDKRVTVTTEVVQDKVLKGLTGG
jgi:hypothetical protein